MFSIALDSVELLRVYVFKICFDGSFKRLLKDPNGLIQVSFNNCQSTK